MFRSTTIHCNFWSRSKLVPKNNERNFLRKGRRWTKAKALNKTGECRERTIQTTTRVDTLDGHFSSWTITTGGWTLLFLFFFLKDAPRGSLPYVCTEADHPGAPWFMAGQKIFVPGYPIVRGPRSGQTFSFVKDDQCMWERERDAERQDART